MARELSNDLPFFRNGRYVTITLLFFLVVGTAWYLVRFSDFTNDDFHNLQLLQQTGLWRFIWTRAEVHYVPLHRLLTWFAYSIDPLNFPLVVGILMVFYIGILAYLLRCMDLFRAGIGGDLVVCGYAASASIICGLGWWAHAEHRVPYVFFDVCAIYHYLAWLKHGRRGHLWIAAVAFVAAFGFYEKAVLIPMHMLIIGYLSDEARFRARARQVAIFPLILGLGSLGFVFLYLHLRPDSIQTPLMLALRGDLEFVKMLYLSVSGLAAGSVNDVPVDGVSPRLIILLLFTLLMFVFSFWRKRGSWMILAAMLVVSFLGYFPIALSNRVGWYGLSIAHQRRFYFEELQLIVLFLGLWFSRVAANVPSKTRRAAVMTAGMALVLVYAEVNVSSLRAARLQPLSWQWDLNQSHNYMSHLRAGLAGIREAEPIFENNLLPKYLSLFNETPDTQTLLPLFKRNIRFDDSATPRYKVLQDGRVVSVR